MRTHYCGELNAGLIDSVVTLGGWAHRRRDHGGVVFVDLRDASGYVQVVVREEEAHALRNEFCVLVTGEVRFDRGSLAMYANDSSNYRQVPIGVVVTTLSLASGALAAAPLLRRLSMARFDRAPRHAV